PGDVFNHEGFLTMDWLRENTSLEEADYFVCGPLPFLRAFVPGLLKAGVPEDRVHYEFFGPVEDLFEGEDIPAPALAAPLPAAKTYRRSDSTKITDADIGLALIGSASDAVVASDRDGTIILWNPGAERIFGFTEE